MSGTLVTVLSARAGCGATTLATNLAAVWQQGGATVCIVDLNLQADGVADALAVAGEPTLSAIAGREVSDELLGELVRTSPAGPDTVLAPTAPGEQRLITAEPVSRLLSLLRRRYDVVVVDAGATMGPVALAALDLADRHVLVGAPQRPVLRALRAAMDSMDLLGYPRRIRTVVINRGDARAGLSAAEIHETLRVGAVAAVPNDQAAVAAMNAGHPLATAQPDHPLSTAIRQLAGTVLVGYPLVSTEAVDTSKTTAVAGTAVQPREKAMRKLIERARREQSGFTLIELLIVIVILGVLAGVVVFATRGITDRGVESACKADAKTVQVASEAYYAKNASYATAMDDATHTATTLVGAGFLHSAPSSDKYTITYTAADGNATCTVN